jgi:hypothetical protein
MASGRRIGRKRALRLAHEAVTALDARISVTEGDDEVYEGPVVGLEYLDDYEELVPIEVQEAALERAAVLLARQGLEVTFRPRIQGETFKAFVEICLDPVHDAAMRDLLGSPAPESPEITTLESGPDRRESGLVAQDEPFIVKDLSEGVGATAALARGLAQVPQIVADAGCSHLQVGIPETGLVLYALGAPDESEGPLKRLADRLIDAGSTPGEPLREMPAELRLEIITRTSDFGAIGHTLEIQIAEQPPAGWSVLS